MGVHDNSNFVGRTLILPGFRFASSYQQIVPFQRISCTAHGAERLRELTIVLPSLRLSVILGSGTPW